MTPAVLTDIAAAQGALDTIDTQLSAAIDAIEQALADRISTRIEIEIANEPFTRLAFGKVHGGKRLLVEQGGELRPLAGAPRAVRASVFSAGHLERLLTEAASQIRSQVVSRKAATEAANNILIKLGHQQGV